MRIRQRLFNVPMMMFFILPLLLQAVSVYDIQFTDDPSGASLLEGQTVTVSGIITATGYYSSGNTNRFFLSDPEGGAWRGVFCFNWDYEVSEGDLVEFSAEVDEYYGFTELINLANLQVISSGNPLPEPVQISTSDLAGEEAYEGCYVRVNMVEVSQTPDNYGQWYVNDGSGACQIDDNIFGYDNISMGDGFYSITGAVDYSYDEYGLCPRRESDFIPLGPPIIQNITEDPGYAVFGSDVEISANIVDYDGQVMVTEIFWRLRETGQDPGEWQNEQMQPYPGDIYKYTLNGLDAEIFYYEYYIYARDNENNETESEIKEIYFHNEDVVLLDISLLNSPLEGDSLLVDAILENPFADELDVNLLYTKNYNGKEYIVPMTEDSLTAGLYHGIILPQKEGTTLHIGVFAGNDTLAYYFYDQISYTYPVKSHEAILKIAPHPFDPFGRDNDPDNDEIKIEYLAQAGDRVIMRIYNAEGKLMVTPVNETVTNLNGINSYYWDGRDRGGEALPWGLYICHIEVKEKNSGDRKTAKVPIVIGAPLK